MTNEKLRDVVHMETLTYRDGLIDGICSEIYDKVPDPILNQLSSDIYDAYDDFIGDLLCRIEDYPPLEVPTEEADDEDSVIEEDETP